MRRHLLTLAAAPALLLLPVVAASQMMDGKHVYEMHCAVCHGPAGDGNGQAAQRPRTKPADLTA